MEISAEKAEAYFNKGMVIWIYDDAGDMFYDTEKAKPVETRWCIKSESTSIQVDTWQGVLDSYKERGENITSFCIATSTGISKYWRKYQ